MLFAGALGTTVTGDFMFDFSTGAGVPLAHWDTTGRLFNRYDRGLHLTGMTGDFMFDFSTGAGVPLAHWDTTGRLFNRYYVQTYRRVTLS